MITIFKKESTFDSTNEKKKDVEIRGLSTDTKPSIEDLPDLTNGSVFIEIDTGKIYFYDAENNLWKEI